MTIHTLPNLRARIDKLSATIETHKQILRTLESSRSDARRELNAILDPMARLPLEIASEILLDAISNPPVPHPSAGPLLFLSVSHLWQNIALSTPSLWASLRLNSVPRGKLFAQGCEAWISRARTLPLSLSLRGSLGRRICAVIKQNADQLRNLDICVPSAEDLDRLLVPFPVLTTLTIGAFTNRTTEAYFLGADEILEMLRAAPALEVFELKEVHPEEDIHCSGVYAEALTHASLRELRLGTSPPGRGRTSAIILQYLTLPALNTLVVSDLDITHADFIAFMTRSSPPLRSLSLNVAAMDADEWSSDLVINYFQLIPGLTHLDVWIDGDEEADEDPFAAFLQLLAAVPDFLPNVKDLTLRTFSLDAQERENLLRGLTMRRASRDSPLEFCQIVFWPGDSGNMSDILPSLRQLVKNGLRMHIGHEGGRNLI
ncbi:hypothetical protein C8R46DRAFT_1107698 [Mycena filopes]|nr:hypothetical protein C8R46DRAFT_1107698 [Mycena filopes]